MGDRKETQPNLHENTIKCECCFFVAAFCLRAQERWISAHENEKKEKQNGNIENERDRKADEQLSRPLLICKYNVTYFAFFFPFILFFYSWLRKRNMNFARSVTNSIQVQYSVWPFEWPKRYDAACAQCFFIFDNRMIVQVLDIFAWWLWCAYDGRQLYCSPIQVTDSVLTCSRIWCPVQDEQLLMLIRNIRNKKIQPILCISLYRIHSELNGHRI